MTKALSLIAALLVAIVLGIAGTTPPAPRGADSPPQVFAAGRAMADVRRIAGQPHPAASPADATVRTYLASRMAAMGMEVRTASFTASAASAKRLAWWSGRADPAPVLTNVIGVLPGKDRALPAVLLMAHHDTVWGSAGAADDTAGVAALLEVVRAVRTAGQPPRDLVVLFTDGEELGLDGAAQFFSADPLHLHIGAIVNVEARGGGGRTTLFQTSADNGAAIALAAGAIGRPAGSSLGVYVYKVLPNDTDLTMALRQPYTAFNYAFIGRPWLYHSPRAVPDRLDQGSLQDMGAQVLDLTRALLGAEQLPGKAADVVFFDVFGLFMLVYPAWAGWIMIGVAAAGLAFAARPAAGWREMVAGAGRMLALIVGAGLLMYLANRLSLAPGKPNYYDRLAAMPRLEAMALCGGLATFLLAMGNWRSRAAGQIGAALPLLLLGIAAQLAAPTAAYIVVLPVMLVAGAIAMPSAARLLAVAVAAIVTGYMLSFGHQLMQGVGTGIPEAAALPLALSAAAVLPIWPGISVKTARVGALLFVLLAAGIALSVRLDPLADTVPPYSADK